MVFSITDKDFLDKNKVKILIGCAGRGKSSVVNNFLQSHDEDFIWTTSTNKLKRDARERYNCEASTVCSTLFENENGRFYMNEKEVDHRTVVIDEILQTSAKVLSWIANHVGKNNIIIMTDTKQMLAIDNNSSDFVKRFESFMREAFVIVDEDVHTKRARDTETKDKIEYLYTQSDERSTEFVKDLQSHRFDVIRYENMKFDMNDVYITHLNETEEMLYRDQKLSQMNYTSDQLIAKGSISSKPPRDHTRYPILSQSQAEKIRSQAYYQLANVGSCTRYQGSEVTDTQKLYYIITLDSRVTNREWYTVVSRCWKLDSIVIVVADKKKTTKLTTLRNKKIKDIRTLVLTT